MTVKAPFDSYVVAILAAGVIASRPSATAEDAVRAYEDVLAVIRARPPQPPP